ncbi:MAG: MotA/TolQ/ExbB proton channel family protein [Alphaproteobacteria bacterium]|nr:MotA/TolQ/ExbB proton channel family protein [Alphaproteobacteria bacterium]
MNNQFHRNLNRMAFFAALVVGGMILWHAEFMHIATTNIWLNGIIIGTTIFGIGLCFADIFRLIPEYRWMKRFFSNNPKANDLAMAELPPNLLRPVAIMLNRTKTQRNNYISAQTLDNFLNIIVGRFEDSREAIRYITNTLIFLGLLGTFWGLIHTVGGFAEMVSMLDFDDEHIMYAVQNGLARPMNGMSVAFASSLLGLGGSLIVGFLGLQATLAQNAMFRELEENLSDRARLFGYLGVGQRGEETALPYVNIAAKELTKAIERLEKAVTKINK